MFEKGQKVQLVLAAGGARGMAHIGVIEELEKAGCQIVEVVGCSMGAVIGGLYAAGHLEPYHQWLLKQERADILRMMDFTLPRHGFLKGEKVFSTILNMTGAHRIEELKIPFAAVATELESGREVVYREGDLFEALRASISIPGIFTPLSSPRGTLVDGGVINPLPLNLIEPREDTMVVAVDINAPGPTPSQTKKEQNSESTSWLGINWPFKNDSEPKNRGAQSLLDVLQTSYEHMQNQLIKLMVERYQPHLLVSIPRSTCTIFEFHRAAEVIQVGRDTFQQALAKAQTDD
jgi:NTE family protein